MFCRLNKLIKEGKIPEECLYYKFLNDTTSLAMIDSSKASDFHWDHEVCEFFETIKYLGGQKNEKFCKRPRILMELDAVERNSLQLLQILISVVCPLMPLIIAKQVKQRIVG